MKKTFVRLLWVMAMAAVPAQARDWQYVRVPGAECGDGSEYGVYVSRKNPTKWTFAFQGGGACWDYLSCFGPIPFTRLRLTDGPTEGNSGILSDDAAASPVSEHSMVYVPYCTGDVFVGNHVARYGLFRKKTVRHVGRANVEKAVDHLIARGTFEFSRMTDIVIYGGSAGAIGAASHALTLDTRIPAGARKGIVMDSPGLHWGRFFWRKFPIALLRDFRSSLSAFGMEFDLNNANLSREADKACQAHQDWNIGILQASRDLVMSVAFGFMDPLTHERIVYGRDGVYERIRNSTRNCSAWVPNGTDHVYLNAGSKASKRAGGISAIDFARQVLSGDTGHVFR